MASLVIRLDPRRLSNPDLDIRYLLPDLLAAKSAGFIIDDGYDYVGDVPFLAIFLSASDLQTAINCVLEVVQNVRVLENDLRDAAVVAVKRNGDYEVIYPSGFDGQLTLD